MLSIAVPPAPMMRPMKRTSLPYGLSGWDAATVGNAANGNDGELLRGSLVVRDVELDSTLHEIVELMRQLDIAARAALLRHEGIEVAEVELA